MYSIAMDILRCLETFCAVVESGSFTAAAEKRYLTQPSVSTHIRDLEKHYGTKLLNRRRDRITATDTGKLLYRYAKNLLRMAKETEDAIDEINNLIRGEVTIGASSVPGTYLVPTILSAFKKKHPGIHLSMEVSDSSIVINQVFEQKVDFGIVGEKLTNPCSPPQEQEEHHYAR
jgi:DNA-binding transcriptional LysR family regulator